MKITINTPEIARHTGYGRAASELSEALEKAGVDIVDDSGIIINFCMPKDYEYRDLTIGYTPWESTEVPEGWMEHLLAVDDLWTTSSWTAEIFRRLTSRDVFVLRHGLADIWVPNMHRRSKTFTFLHIGEPAVRKGGDIVLEAWYRGFRHSGCKLIYKTTGHPMARVKDKGGSIIYSPADILNDGGKIINSVYSDDEMLSLYGEVDCLVYPSRGEGFGLIPFEAMACGLPTILPGDGGTKDFSAFGVDLKKYMWRCSDVIEHPGLWMDHKVDEVIDLMNEVKDDYEYHAQRSYENSFLLRESFGWDRIAKNFIQRVDTAYRLRYNEKL